MTITNVNQISENGKTLTELFGLIEIQSATLLR